MRRAISIVFSVFLAASILVLPTGSVAAKPDSPPQMSAPSPAQSADEEETIIRSILDELDKAAGMTNDPDIRKHIAVLKDWVKKLRELIRRGDKKAALDTKYLIAERLEWLINQLPVATAPPTLAAVTASPNPLYDELVRIRIKLDKLIALERMPEAVPPPPPEIERPPETEKFGVYSVKFLCGPSFGKEGVQPGSYSTAINVHNPHNQTVYLYKKAVIAKREDEPRGRISGFRRVVLAPDEAIEIDCIDIVSLFRGLQRATVAPPPQQVTTAAQLQISVVPAEEQPTPQNQPTVFAKGFVVIYASAPLDVVAVYTASTAGGFSLDVEYVGATGRGSPVWTPPDEGPPGDGEECPAECYCLTKEEAYKRNLTTLCRDRPCGYNIQGVPRYCWKAEVQTQCPQGCVCLSKDDAYKRYGPNASTCTDQPCGRDQYQNPLYCWKPTEQPKCPDNCACVTEVEAKRLGLDLCQGQRTLCGYDQQQNPLYCFQKPPQQAPCPTGCVCLSKEEGYKRYGPNAVLCQDQPCGRDQYQNPLYCWKPGEQAACPQGCTCLTKDEAYQKFGANAVLCQDAPCGYAMAATAAVQIPKYCWKAAPTTTQPQCPQGCYCLIKDEAAKRGYNTLCQSAPCGYDQYQNPLYCWKYTPPTTTQCPQGCYCLTKDDAAKRGYTTLCQDAPCGYDQYQNPLYCWRPPATTGAPTIQPLCPSGCTCLTKADAQKQGYTVLCQDAPCGYDQYQNPKYCFKKPLLTIPLIPRTTVK
ncbi:MAG: hypothetical protein FJ008_06765 [Chloroflexi bacterium]|nr:hypothetical protein [Chloroflexota bacterium]MBM3176006.1 hypothetical protein [Chloroflexota bacterium]